VNDLPPVIEDLSIFILGGRIKSEGGRYGAHGQFGTAARTPVIEQAQAAERLGLRRAWLSERLNLKESGVLLGAAAAVTSRIEVGTGALGAATRPPVTIAAMGATMAAAFGPRYILGLGRGHRALYAGHGFPEGGEVGYRSLVDRARIIHRLWRGETVDYDGPAGRYENLRMVDIPDTPPQIWFVHFGGPVASRAAADPVFDGMMLADGVNPAAVRKCRAYATRECERIGRDPDSLHIAVPVITAPNVSDEETRSLVHSRIIGILEMKGPGEIFCRLNDWDPAILDKVRSHPLFQNMTEATADLSFHRDELLEVTRLLPDEWMREAAGIGTIEECVASLRRFKDAGADEIALYGSTPEQNAELVDAWAGRSRVPSAAEGAS
jgi:probable F420-dependent oxidoreductase